MKPQEYTPEWVKENLFMVDGNDITDCYSDESIDHISRTLSKVADDSCIEGVLKEFHLIMKNIITN